MDKRTFNKLVKNNFKSFAKENGFKIIKSTILVKVSNDTLNIISFDFGKSGFTCDIAIQPLYIVDDVINLSFGNRISRFNNDLKERWRYGTEEEVESSLLEVKKLLEEVAIEWFYETGNPAGIIKFIEEGKANDPRYMVGFPPVQKSLFLGYSYVYIGDYKKGENVLSALLNELDKDSRPWVNQIKEQVILLKETFLESDDRVKAFLEDNISKTKEELKVE